MQVDIALPSIAPRAVADLRAEADSVLPARVDRHAAVTEPGTSFAPPSFVQEGLVARGFMGPSGPGPVSADGGASIDSGHGPKRVLKPRGVPMLPYDDGVKAHPDARPDAQLIASNPAAADDPPLSNAGVAAPS
jgi:hypothetical protein